MRPGMTTIVQNLRQHGQASPFDEFNGVQYWSDDQLEAIADAASERLTLRLVLKTLVGKRKFGVDAPRHIWGETDTYQVFDVTDPYRPVEVVISSVYTPALGLVEFAEDLDTTKRYVIEMLAVNNYLALADLWEQKAAQRADFTDFKAGNNKIDLSQEHEHCCKIAAYYRSKIIRRYDRTGAGRWAK